MQCSVHVDTTRRSAGNNKGHNGLGFIDIGVQCDLQFRDTSKLLPLSFHAIVSAPTGIALSEPLICCAGNGGACITYALLACNPYALLACVLFVTQCDPLVPKASLPTVPYGPPRIYYVRAP